MGFADGSIAVERRDQQLVERGGHAECHVSDHPVAAALLLLLFLLASDPDGLPEEDVQLAGADGQVVGHGRPQAESVDRIDLVDEVEQLLDHGNHLSDAHFPQLFLGKRHSRNRGSSSCWSRRKRMPIISARVMCT